ncbi:MAG TPA: hypothetical protein VLC46_07105 [Thermoanaerobaculia bacterium]|nr:hypothetical protein [Thermoanaerobaculia bacterium]
MRDDLTGNPVGTGRIALPADDFVQAFDDSVDDLHRPYVTDRL